MIFSSMDRRHVSLVEVLGSTIECSKRRAYQSSKHDEGNGTHTTLKPTGDRLTGSVELALMNWMSKGDRATAPFSQELSKSGCVNGALW